MNVNYSIVIEPILTGGDPESSGKYLLLANQKVDYINFNVFGDSQTNQISYKGTSVIKPNTTPVLVQKISINNNIFNPIGQSTITLNINDNFGQNLLQSPLLDLFREGDIVRVSYFISEFTQQQIFVGSIEVINISYGLRGLEINLSVGYLTNILSRSALVQTEDNQQVQGKTISFLAPTQLQFGAFLEQLLSETYINQTVSKTQYFGGVSSVDGVTYMEEIASGKASISTVTRGSAINSQSYVYAITSATESKLDCILQILYPYQRIFYVNPEGNFIITPLTIFFDKTEGWRLDIFGDPTSIPLSDINITKNTAIVQNRGYSSFNSLYVQFNKSDIFNTPGQANAAQSIATPTQFPFPRAYDFVASGKGLQTEFSIQSIDATSLLQNSGLLNTAIELSKGITGMIVTNIIDNNNQTITAGTAQNSIKFITSLYSSRALSESLFRDTLVDVKMPTIETYSYPLQRFRNIPLNQMVEVPPMNNNNFDTLNQLFCYGFSIDWSLDSGSTTTLNLCKPFVFTCLWCNSLREI